MKRFVVLSLCALVLACKQNAAETKVQPKPEEKIAKAEPAPAAPVVKKEAPAQDAKVTVDEGLVKKYLAYKKESLELAKKAIEEMAANVKDHQDKGAVGALGMLKDGEQINKKHEEAQEAAQAKVGLSDAELKALEEVVSDVVTARMLWDKTGAGTLATMEAQVKAQVAALPAEERAKAQAEMGQMMKSMTDMRDCTEARKKHGDAAVNAVLAHEAELKEAQLAGLKMLGGMK
ncbi:MAG: hypothetical protein HY901_33795 [Deltaproteobacteria bacterium]|nr:hypothetical protein [Deltaproteobacteria bacterium]